MKIAIYGYGNLGRGIESTATQNKDAELVGVFTRRKPSEIKTLTGMANAVCAGFDSLPWEGVLGTIAGDDTILVITESEQSAKKLADTLRGFQKS